MLKQHNSCNSVYTTGLPISVLTSFTHLHITYIAILSHLCLSAILFSTCVYVFIWHAFKPILCNKSELIIYRFITMCTMFGR